MSNFYSGHGNKKLMIPDLVKNNVDNYFDEIDDKIKKGIKAAYTVAGLARSLNINRESLLNYLKLDVNSLNDDDLKIFEIINSGMDRILEFMETQLITTNFASGVKFNLVNSYNWVDKKEIKADISTNTKDIDNDELKEFVQGNINKI